jgi:hypothetical protein
MLYHKNTYHFIFLFGAVNANEFNNGTPQRLHFGIIKVISISVTTYLNATSLEGHEKLDVCVLHIVFLPTFSN